jgi:thiol-disulfide isomerase/thioredoxin
MFLKSFKYVLPALGLLAILAQASGTVLADAPGRITIREVKAIDGRMIPLVPSTGGATAVVFYSTECPISNAYSPLLKTIAESQPNATGFSMVGVCVDPDLSNDEITKHAQEYGLKFPIVADHDGAVTSRLGIKVTPEAILIDDTGKIRYRGRIDDTYAARGKRKANPSTNELKDAIACVLAGKEVAVENVEAIGCPIPIPPKVPVNPTFAKDVAPILQKNCQECHRPGQVGPFSLVTYEQARKRADDIAEVVTERRMPVWKPDPHVGPSFKNSKALSEDEIATLVAWAKAEAPQGDPADMPPAPVYRDGWALGDPDLVIELPEEFKIPAEGNDIYRCFVVPTNVPEDKYVSGIEYRPGNRKVVHHIIGYVDTSGGGRKRDKADPGPGYSCFSGPEVEVFGDLGGWAPGYEPSFLPEGIARLLPGKADAIIQVHYHPSGKPETDRTKVGLYFSKKPVKQALHTNMVIQRIFELPPKSENIEVDAGWKIPGFAWKVPVDITAIGITPHMHRLGKDMTVTATFPDGTSLDLIKIPDWDFNWQSMYYFEKPLDLPKGTMVKLKAHFNNPTDKAVHWGEATTDEMAIGFLSVVQKGQDLTRPGEQDTLRDVFKKQGEERKKFTDEFYKKYVEPRRKAGTK